MMKLKTLLSANRRASVRNAAVAVMFMAGCGLANASWLTGVQNTTTLFRAMIVAFVVVCVFVGLAAFAYAGSLIYKKSGDRGEDIEWKRVGYAMVAGLFFSAISWVSVQTLETMGASASDVGAPVQVR